MDDDAQMVAIDKDQLRCVANTAGEDGCGSLD